MKRKPSFDGRLIAHAWINLPSDKVFDGVEQEFFNKKSYYAVFNAKEEVVYDYDEMMRSMAESNTNGPWHATKGELGKRGIRLQYQSLYQ